MILASVPCHSVPRGLVDTWMCKWCKHCLEFHYHGDSLGSRSVWSLQLNLNIKKENIKHHEQHPWINTSIKAVSHCSDYENDNDNDAKGPPSISQNSS